MYNNQTVVDVHGHMTTPAVFRQFLAETVSQNTPGRKLDLSDEQLEAAQQRHLKFMDDRNIDVQLIGPRPIAMWHWMRPFLQEYWAYVTNNVIGNARTPGVPPPTWWTKLKIKFLRAKR